MDYGKNSRFSDLRLGRVSLPHAISISGWSSRGSSRWSWIGLPANACIESTGRFAMELGYHVTLVKDATAASSKDRMHACARAEPS